MKNSKKETQMSDLKPCPFCGTSNEKHNNIVKLYDDEYYAYEHCNACGARVYANWNNRPIEDALQARIDELEKLNRAALERLTEHACPPNRRNYGQPCNDSDDCVACWREFLMQETANAATQEEEKCSER